MKTTFLKSLLVAAGLFVGASAWAGITESVVVNANFDDDGAEALFTGASRMGVEIVEDADKGSKVLKFSCAGNSQNGYSLATYDFSEAIGGDASSVKVEFDFNIPNANAAYRRLFTVGHASLRTGFGKQAYTTAGAMFAFGLARNSSANYFSIGGASTKAAADAAAEGSLGAWCHAEINVNISDKKVSYKITNLDGSTTFYSGEDVAFLDASASACNQIDFFDCQNNTVSYMDNLVVTKYVDESKVSVTFTVNYIDSDLNPLKDAAVYNTFVGDTYIATSADMETFFSDDKLYKYVYKDGNEEKTATANAADNEIYLIFDVYDQVAYTITAKNGEETLSTLAEGNAYSDGSTTVYWSKYMKSGDKWYETSGSYGKTITEAGNTDVEYKASDVFYFVETENITKSRSAAADKIGTEFSGGKTLRHYANSQWWTDAFEEGGNFILVFPYRMANASASTLVIKTRNADGEYAETGLSLTTNTAGTFSEMVTIPAGSSLAIVNEAEWNSNILIDYVALFPVTSVPATISATGFNTFSSTFDLDLANLPEGVKAYFVEAKNIKDNKVTLTEVNEAVEAGTGLLLKGEAGVSYNIPIAESAYPLHDNILVGCPTAVVLDKSTANYASLYVLAGTEKASFYNLKSYLEADESNAVSIPAGKAYLDTSSLETARLEIVFPGEATAVQELKNSRIEGLKSYFNLNGQRVAQPVKGLYIVNGKKVIK